MSANFQFYLSDTGFWGKIYFKTNIKVSYFLAIRIRISPNLMQRIFYFFKAEFQFITHNF